MQTLNRTLWLAASLICSGGIVLNISALDYKLQGLDLCASTNWSPSSPWSNHNLQDWKELDSIPVRVQVNGEDRDDTLVLTFPHFDGARSGFQNFYFISNSANVSVTSEPVLTAPAIGDWSYTLSLRKSDGNEGYIYLYARLAAGSREYGGSSLHLKGPALAPLQIHKPKPGPGLPDLTIVKSGPANASPGELITYTISYTNKANGTNNPAHGVQITDTLPELVTFVGASDGGNITENTLDFHIPDLTNGASGFVTYQVRVVPSAIDSQSFTNSAIIFADEDDGDSSDNDSSTRTLVHVGDPKNDEPLRITLIEKTAEGDYKVHFTTTNGRFYSLQSTADFLTWATDATVVPGTGSIVVSTQSVAGPQRFFRVLRLP